MESEFGIKMADKRTFSCHTVSTEPCFRYQTMKFTKQITTMHMPEGRKTVDRLPE